MPNWCENKLLIKADCKDALDDFKRLERLFEETLIVDKKTGHVSNLLDSIIRMPEVLEDTSKEKPYKLPSGNTIWWYEWCNDNWGTKWDAVDCVMKRGSKVCPTSDRMDFKFRTAWAPPINWLTTVGAIFSNLWFKLEYDEPGACFKGIACGRGEIIDDWEEYE